MRDDKERLLDIREQIEFIEEDVLIGRNAFDSDRHIRDSMILRIATIGEACRAMSKEFRERYPDIPWTEIIGMRAKLMHDYFDVDEEEVWRTAQRDIPALRHQIERLIAENLDHGDLLYDERGLPK